MVMGTSESSAASVEGVGCSWRVKTAFPPSARLPITPGSHPHKLSPKVAFPEQPVLGPPQLTSLFSRLDQTPCCHSSWWLPHVMVSSLSLAPLCRGRGWGTSGLCRSAPFWAFVLCSEAPKRGVSFGGKGVPSVCYLTRATLLSDEFPRG